MNRVKRVKHVIRKNTYLLIKCLACWCLAYSALMTMNTRKVRHNFIPKIFSDYWSRGENTFSTCEFFCEMTSNFMEADVAIFTDFKMRTRKFRLPQRMPNQIWMIKTRETPYNIPVLRIFNRPDIKGQFNWTRTVLKDSTFPMTYGAVVPRRPPTRDYEMIYESKIHEAAWFVSQCPRPSRRGEYVQRMMADMSVHIYGKCGNYTCGNERQHWVGQDTCLNMVSTQYKFYLSFENSFCRDYVTEKVFNMYGDNMNVIPVVRGGINYSSVLPAGTYVDASDFRSPSELAKYLRELSRDKVRYISILKEKNKFVSQRSSPFNCDLCEAAHKRRSSIYRDVGEWFSPQRNCYEPTDL